MKVTIKSYDREVSWSNDRDNQIIDETTVEDAYEAFKGLLITLGFSAECIDADILEQATAIRMIEDLYKKEKDE
mgnify:CR=1 FL=1